MAKPQLKKVETLHHDDHGHAGGGGHDDHGGGGHCPPPWIITFADMATLLMAFFVIMLMTAKTDQPKFNAFAAVMRQTFGTIPLDERDGQGGLSIINLSPGPQSGEETDQPPATTPQSGNPEIEDSGRADGTQNPGGATGTGESETEAAAALGAALQKALAQGEMTVASDTGKVVVQLPKGSDQQDAQALADALEKAIRAQAAPPGDAGQDSPGDVGPERAGVRAEIAEMQMARLLQEQITDGEVKVEREEGRIVVTVGSGGAFASGSADLTAQAREIIAKLEMTAQKATRIVVTGHTDDIPVSGAYSDNWDLAAARAQSVVREIEQSGLVPNATLEAVSKGETEPIADNATPEGREKNRRIEIKIEFE